MKKIRLNSNIRCIEIVYGDSYYEGPARWIVTLDVLKYEKIRWQKKPHRLNSNIRCIEIKIVAVFTQLFYVE